MLVTERIAPLRRAGRALHQVGLPYHWGERGLAPATRPTTCFALVLDPNVHIQEVQGRDLRHPARPPAARPALRELVERTRTAGTR